MIKKIFTISLLYACFLIPTSVINTDSQTTEISNYSVTENTLIGYSEPEYTYYWPDEADQQNYVINASFYIYTENYTFTDTTEINYTFDVVNGPGIYDFIPASYDVTSSGVIVYVPNLQPGEEYNATLQIDGVIQDLVIDLDTEYLNNEPSLWAWVSLGLLVGIILLSIISISTILVISTKKKKNNFKEVY